MHIAALAQCKCDAVSSLLQSSLLSQICQTAAVTALHCTIHTYQLGTHCAGTAAAHHSLWQPSRSGRQGLLCHDCPVTGGVAHLLRGLKASLQAHEGCSSCDRDWVLQAVGALAVYCGSNICAGAVSCISSALQTVRNLQYTTHSNYPAARPLTAGPAVCAARDGPTRAQATACWWQRSPTCFMDACRSSVT